MKKEQATGLRVAFETLGCRSNYADTIDLQAALVERGAIPCDFNSPADVYVLNTCTVTDAADKTAYKLLRRIKRDAPEARIVVTGCLAEVGTGTLESLAIADAIIGPGRKAAVVDAILGDDDTRSNTAFSVDERGRANNVQWRSDSVQDLLSSSITGPGQQLGEVKNRARFHLRIQEGCENNCTFCIIPHSRGLLSSREIEAVLVDIEHLVSIGYNEAVLTGTHLGGFGEDHGEGLFELLRALEEKSPLRRIRLSSIDPNDLNAEIIEFLGESSSDPWPRHTQYIIQAFHSDVS